MFIILFLKPLWPLLVLCRFFGVCTGLPETPGVSSHSAKASTQNQSTGLQDQVQNNNVGALEVEVRTSEPSGQICVGIQSSDQFLSNRFLASIAVANKNNSVRVRLSDLPTDKTVAVTVFQDLNNNNRLDRNHLGIPTEPFGFSRNVKVKFRQPNFGETAIRLKPGLNTTTIDLYRWSM
jgi:uncharacterized protein (DUF2141 family)